LTDEERAAQKKDELTKHVRGLIQRFLDGIMDVERMKEEMEALPINRRDEAMALLIDLCVEGFELSKDNSSLFQILEKVAQVNPDPFIEVLASYEGKMQEGYRKAKVRLSNALKEKGISGSAVIPNVHADPDWEKEMSRIQNEFRDAISSIQGTPSSGLR
jgi:hypothetical protein